VRSAFQAIPAWAGHLEANASPEAHLDEVFGIAGLGACTTWAG
jgi:hypothetical protein